MATSLPVSSLHDRACDLFYQLIGGRTDYGVEHSERCGHARWGRHHERPLLPPGFAWSASSPIHLLGHSLGGNTCRFLQQLLADIFFVGHDTSADWIKSVTCIATPLNGSLATYSLGANAAVAPAPAVVPASPGHLLGCGVHGLEALGVSLPRALGPLLGPRLSSGLVDFRINHFCLSPEHRGGILAAVQTASECLVGSRRVSRAWPRGAWLSPRETQSCVEPERALPPC